MTSLLSILSIFMISVFGILFIPAQLHADTIPDNPPRSPVSHITDAILSKDGSFWITGENASIYRLPPGSKDAYSWENMKYFNGFPDTSDFRCLAQDLQGRIWAGTDNCGVAVFNGVEWKTYNRENALCGDHVVDIAVSPITGEVALATSGGITIYNPVSEHWQDLTRAEGLVSDQVESLAFSGDGTLWLAYACGGVSQGSSKSGYTKWRTTQAPWYWDTKQYARQSFKASGDGLPSNLCNTILPVQNGDVLVGTCSGLAIRNKSNKWQYIRGKDYWDKNNGLYGAKGTQKQKNEPNTGKLLNEDYITAFAETDKGIWVGFRNKGGALLNRNTYKTLKTVHGKQKHPMSRPYITAIVPLPGGTVWAGTYGGGLVCLEKGKGEYTWKEIKELSPPAFPAFSHGEQESVTNTMENRESLQKESSPVLFWKEDWSTQGNWVGRYGADYALLCATNSPVSNDVFMSDNAFGIPPKIKIGGRIGCHRKNTDGLRHWVETLNAPGNVNVLFNLQTCNRIEAEWDDHGEAYARTFDGPDVWAIVKVPEGRHTVSLYFYNPNGRVNQNTAMRDYLIEIRQFSSSLPESIIFKQSILDKDDQPNLRCREDEVATILKQPVIAKTRVKDFAGTGVYKTFLIQKKGTYYIRVSKNYSFNTILNGIFVDLVEQENGLPYPRQQFDLDYAGKPLLKGSIDSIQRLHFPEFMNAWKKVNKLVPNNQFLSTCEVEKLKLYRFAYANKLDGNLIDHLRWDIHLWSQKEKDQFEEDMLNIWYHKQDTIGGAYRSTKMFKHSPRTIPFTTREIQIMDMIDINWKQYLPDYPGVPDPSEEELRKRLDTVNDKDFMRLKEKQTQKILKSIKEINKK